MKVKNIIADDIYWAIHEWDCNWMTQSFAKDLSSSILRRLKANGLKVVEVGK